MWVLSKTMPKLIGQPQSVSVETKIQLWMDFWTMWYYSVAIENFSYNF